MWTRSGSNGTVFLRWHAMTGLVVVYIMWPKAVNATSGPIVVQSMWCWQTTSGPTKGFFFEVSGPTISALYGPKLGRTNSVT